METILVTDNTDFWQFMNHKTKIISAIEYLSAPQYCNGKRFRIVNICKSYQYQSLGYYVSLLAEARGHKIFPSVLTIEDIRRQTIAKTISDSVHEDVERAFKQLKSNEFFLSIYFGNNIAHKYEGLSRKLHALFPMPLFRVHFKHNKQWKISQIEAIPVDEIPETHITFLKQTADNFFNKKRFHSFKQKPKYFDLAILRNPDEKTPPSNKKALKHFIEAGETVGINVELIEKSEIKSLNEYDGLFIRETTAVNNHTFLFARMASSERMMVIDDPVSILKCSNKVYLAETLQKHRISTPKTLILSKYNIKQEHLELSYPCVLKKPDGSFSKGVIKVENADELLQNCKTFFKDSDLVIAQAFIPTEFDWRIGILNHQPIFACRYYMAAGHWQIYNWQAEKDDESGEFDCVAINDVPKVVLDTAIKASRLMGDGLYGADIKQNGNKAYVIEINDNPNIDAGIEDKMLGEDLYLLIMNDFLKRMRRLQGYE